MGGPASRQRWIFSADAVDAHDSRAVPGALRAGRLESPPPRAREIDHQQFCPVSDRGEGADSTQPHPWHRSSPDATTNTPTTLKRAARDPAFLGQTER